ncbi:hypothetical protein N3K66_003148 [Trichothecium roseum]|uniref:Uncharacterized protein n=1 Tax=Trichothecium roseum TaxID=47278 RepID=A0ACC0V4L1_9HYPO|nr:hypothetical protein N3K66_003148 [Trichothecium roseum]
MMHRASLKCLRCRSSARLRSPIFLRGYADAANAANVANIASPASPATAADPTSIGAVSTSSTAQSKRPSTAPKPIIDIRHIRSNPELYEQTCIQRNYRRQAAHPARIVELHAKWQSLTRASRATRERSNLLRRQLANPVSTSNEDIDMEDVRQMSREQLQDEARRLKAELNGMIDEEAAVLAEMEELAIELPNLTSDETPLGNEPTVLTYINEPVPTQQALPDVADRPSHVQIGTDLGILDFASAANSAGWGWYYLIGEAAQLEQALIQYSLAVATRYGWTQVSPPSMVYSHIGAACGFQPRDQHGEQQVYTISQSPEDAARGVPEMCLTGTSEISLAGMKAHATINTDDLPLKRVAVSRCYRAEAGARGADTKGLFRVHEFSKVELFAWTPPNLESAEEVFEEMLDMQTEILGSLGLPARVLSMPSTDLGASATRKVDMEAWFPSRARSSNPGSGWGEVSSASLCTDYQTRRLATRTRIEEGKMGFPWTTNGTALAAPRVIAAILENGWDEESGTVKIPECLQPWMDGKERIGAGANRRKKVNGV